MDPVNESSYWDWFRQYLEQKCERSPEDALMRVEELRAQGGDVHPAFREYLQADRRLKENSVDIYLEWLKCFEKLYPHPLTRLDIEGLRHAISEMSQDHAMANYIKAVRHWYRFLTRTQTVKDEEVRSLLKTPKSSPMLVSEESALLTLDDMAEICRRCQTRTWAALWALMFDTGMKPSEVCSLQYEDLKRDEKGYYLQFTRANSGTVESHYLLTWFSFKYFMPYWRTHPGAGLMFTTRSGKSLYPGLLKTNLHGLSKALGKRLYPYLIRESASAWWYHTKMLDLPAIKRRMGYSPRSTMFERRCLMHPDSDYADAVMRAQGEDVPEADTCVQRKCSICKTVNPPESDRCIYCSAVLDRLSDQTVQVISHELQRENERLRLQLDQQRVETIMANDRLIQERVQRRAERDGVKVSTEDLAV